MSFSRRLSPRLRRLVMPHPSMTETVNEIGSPLNSAPKTDHRYSDVHQKVQPDSIWEEPREAASVG